MYICLHVYINMYIYKYTNTHTHIHIRINGILFLIFGLREWPFALKTL